MPWSLFKNRNFVLVTVAGLVLGLVMMGTMAYLPTYLQMATGQSATMSGVYMMPMVVGMLGISFVVNMIIQRTKRYKWSPLGGLFVMMIGLCLLYTMTPAMPIWRICVFMAVMGIGMGMCMQILMLIVRNEAAPAQLGVANATNMYFMMIGMTLGASAMGAWFVSNLKNQIVERLPDLPLGDGGANSLTPALVSSLPDGVREAIIASYNDAMTPIFIGIVPLVAVAFALLLFLRETPLRTTLDEEGVVMA